MDCSSLSSLIILWCFHIVIRNTAQMANELAPGFHTIEVVPGMRFTVPERYSDLHLINSGAQGAVVYIVNVMVP